MSFSTESCGSIPALALLACRVDQVDFPTQLGRPTTHRESPLKGQNRKLVVSKLGYRLAPKTVVQNGGIRSET